MAQASPPQPRRPRRAVDVVADHPWWTALAVVALAIAVLVALWDWNWFKGPVERAVEARTRRSFTIGGDLDVDLGRVTAIRADGLDLGNAEWSQEARMAAVDRLEVRIEVWPLLFRREARIPEIRLSRPDVRLEVGPEREGNWNAFTGGDGGGMPVRLRRLWIEDGHLLFLDPDGETEIDVQVASQPPGEGDAAPPVAIKGEGRWRAAEFQLEGSAQSPLDLQDTESPYRFDLHARAGNTRAHARGSLVDAFQFDTFAFQMALAGRDLEDLYPLLGLALPPTPPYSIDGQLSREGKFWHYRDFSGKVGDSDLGGSVTVETGGERTMFRADLVSRLLDLDDLAGFLGAQPGAGSDDNAEAATAGAPGRVLPDTPYQLEKLHAMDADVRLRAQRIEADLPLDDMDAHLFLDHGLLRLEPLNFGVAGGDIRSTVRMDARESPIRTTLDADVRGLNLGALFPDSTLAGDAVGRIGGHAKLSGTGNSVAQMLGSSDGELAVGMGRGEISALLVEVAGIDIAEALAFLVTRDRKIPIRCAFADFAVADGVMSANALAFDTTDTIIVGEGQIDLGEERLDLLLRPRPKDRSILSLRSPLVIGGTFSNPSFRPDFARLGLRGAVALALGSIAPPAALLATLELGPGEDSDCGGEYAR